MTAGSGGGRRRSHTAKGHWRQRQESANWKQKPSTSWAEWHEEAEDGNDEHDRAPKWGGPRQVCPDALKRTRMCPEVLAHRSCNRESCTFAHTRRELRPQPDLAKTRLCTFYMRGTCPHASACKFAHGESELQAPCVKNTSLSNEDPRQCSNTDRSPPDERAAAPMQTPSPPLARSEDSYLSDSLATTAEDVHRARNKVKMGKSGATLMVLNIPSFLTQGSLLRLFEDLSERLLAEVDFFHVPWDTHEECNHSYAIINFASSAAATDFKAHWDGRRLIKDSGGCLRIVPAVLQGLSANVRHFLGDSASTAALDAKFKPLGREVMPRPIVSLGSLRQLSPGARELRPASSTAVSSEAHSSNELPHRSQIEVVFPMPSQSDVAPQGGGACCHGPSASAVPTCWSVMQTPTNMHLPAQQVPACSAAQPGMYGCWQPMPLLSEPLPAFQPVLGCVPPPQTVHPMVVASTVPPCQHVWSCAPHACLGATAIPTVACNRAQEPVYNDFHRDHRWVQHVPKASGTATTSASGAPTAKQ